MNEFKDVMGYYEKRDCPGGRYECRGTARLIRAGIYLFIPHDKRLSPVESELSQPSRE